MYALPHVGTTMLSAFEVSGLPSRSNAFAAFGEYGHGL
jgi:hypothetical protein